MHQNLFGPTPTADGHCQWRLWAPFAKQAELVLSQPDGTEIAAHRMVAEEPGFYTCEHDIIAIGQRYAYRLDGGPPRPDPASRWQPDGVHRPSAVWNAGVFSWTDNDWHGLPRADLVIYELHVGAFTQEGTFAAIIPRLTELRDLGITAIEIMPVGQYPGDRGWGYDGVYWYAVQHSYGGPAELQRLVNACHACGMAVLLDVIYNHLGPEGNYLGEFGPFFTDRHHTPWGRAINYDGPDSRPVRDFVLDNVRQWVRDFHLDGLRLDAIHSIYDDSRQHILAEIKQAALAVSAPLDRPVHIIAESNLNDVKLLDDPAAGGYGLDAQWSDDFHHCVHTLLTAEYDGYYADFTTPATQLVKALNQVFVYDGCYSTFRDCDFGKPIGGHAGDRFVISIQTHDQVGNRALGDRFGSLLDGARHRLAAGLMLLAPNIPMLFMGEEYGETRPFPFFCDFSDEALREAIRVGRREEFATFSWKDKLLDPFTLEAFQSAILTWSWPTGSPQAGLRNLYRELLALRRTHPAARDYTRRSASLLPDNDDAKVLLLNRGDPHTPASCLWAAFNLSDQPVPTPMLALDTHEVLLSSEAPRFGGAEAADKPTLHGELPPFAFVVLGKATEESA
ncbi:MAG: malto-oligosyltrehalose trehalohydrolase [Pirellulales bacterium]